jgi:hypothetical protein
MIGATRAVHRSLTSAMTIPAAMNTTIPTDIQIQVGFTCRAAWR